MSPELNLFPKVGSADFISEKYQRINILDFARQEAKSKMLYRYLYNH